ncbi:MAG: peptidase M20, partial [Rhodoferax sp.]|nr:peptidase M20 [Rhodoferax sp.]
MNTRAPDPVIDAAAALDHATRSWDHDIVARLSHYIGIPSKSPLFDPEWAENGHIETVLRDAADWVQAQQVSGLRLEIVRLAGRTPLLFFEVPASTGRRADAGPAVSQQTVLMYGHMDKQPEFTGWRRDLGPWTAKYEDGR